MHECSHCSRPLCTCPKSLRAKVQRIPQYNLSPGVHQVDPHLIHIVSSDRGRNNNSQFVGSSVRTKMQICLKLVQRQSEPVPYCSLRRYSIQRKYPAACLSFQGSLLKMFLKHIFDPECADGVTDLSQNPEVDSHTMLLLEKGEFEVRVK